MLIWSLHSINSDFTTIYYPNWQLRKTGHRASKRRSQVYILTGFRVNIFPTSSCCLYPTLPPSSLNKGDTDTHILSIKMYVLPLPFLHWHMTLVLMQNEMSMCHSPFQKALILPELRDPWSSVLFYSYFYSWIIEKTVLFLWKVPPFSSRGAYYSYNGSPFLSS